MLTVFVQSCDNIIDYKAIDKTKVNLNLHGRRITTVRVYGTCEDEDAMDMPNLI